MIEKMTFLCTSHHLQTLQPVNHDDSDGDGQGEESAGENAFITDPEDQEDDVTDAWFDQLISTVAPDEINIFEDSLEESYQAVRQACQDIPLDDSQPNPHFQLEESQAFVPDTQLMQDSPPITPTEMEESHPVADTELDESLAHHLEAPLPSTGSVKSEEVMLIDESPARPAASSASAGSASTGVSKQERAEHLRAQLRELELLMARVEY